MTRHPPSTSQVRAWRVGGQYPPIIGRAVVRDIAWAKGLSCIPDSYAITPHDLKQAEAERLRRGDIALIRMGRTTYWPDPEAFLRTLQAWDSQRRGSILK